VGTQESKIAETVSTNCSIQAEDVHEEWYSQFFFLQGHGSGNENGTNSSDDAKSQSFTLNGVTLSGATNSSIFVDEDWIGSLHIENSIMVNNTSREEGAVVAVLSPWTSIFLSYCTLANNEGKYGTILSLGNYVHSISNCHFEGNKGVVVGAALSLYGRQASMNMIDCTLSRNVGNFGAITSNGHGLHSLSNCLFEANECQNETYNGGSVMTLLGDLVKKIFVDDCCFISNQSPSPGTIVINGESEIVKNQWNYGENNQGGQCTGIFQTIGLCSLFLSKESFCSQIKPPLQNPDYIGIATTTSKNSDDESQNLFGACLCLLLSGVFAFSFVLRLIFWYRIGRHGRRAHRH